MVEIQCSSTHRAFFLLWQNWLSMHPYLPLAFTRWPKCAISTLSNQIPSNQFNCPAPRILYMYGLLYSPDKLLFGPHLLSKFKINRWFRLGMVRTLPRCTTEKLKKDTISKKWICHYLKPRFLIFKIISLLWT